MKLRSIAALSLALACDPPPPPVDAQSPSATASSVASVPRPVPPRPRKKYSVAVLGDSLTDENTRGGGYVKLLRERCPESRFDNYGKGGDMLTHITRRYRRDLFGPKKPKYDHLILFAGVNDLYSDGRNPKTISEDMSRIFGEAREHGMKITAITVAPWGGFKRYFTPKRGERTRELNDWIRGRRAAGEVDFVVDAFALLGCGTGDVLCPEVAKPFIDGIHFGPVGHERVGRALFGRVFSDCL
jgi:lysophospholipase L1-like esterase